jgi:hypothetical protein
MISEQHFPSFGSFKYRVTSVAERYLFDPRTCNCNTKSELSTLYIILLFNCVRDIYENNVNNFKGEQ